MMHLQILNTRQAKKLVEKLGEQFGFEGRLDYTFLKSSKGKIYIVSRDISRIRYDDFRIDSMGMYFAEGQKDGTIRLSIEGSQLVGPKATKSIVELDDMQLKEWFAGEDVAVDTEEHGFHLVKHNNDFIGTGRISNNLLKNFVPKTRRINKLSPG